MSSPDHETTTAQHTGWVVKFADRYMKRPMMDGRPSEWTEDFREALIVPSQHLHIKDREELSCFFRYELEPVWHTTFGEGDRMHISDAQKPAVDWADNRCSECLRQALDATRKGPSTMATRTRKKKAPADELVDVDHETINASILLAYDTDAGTGVTCGILEDDESRVFLELVAEVDDERRGVRLMMNAHSVARLIRRLATVQAMILPDHV